MEPISRRSALGIATGIVASGIIAGGMIAEEAAALDATPAEKSEEHAGGNGANESPYKFRMSSATPRVYGASSIREHKLHEFPMSSTMSASLIELASGDVREPHWHPNSDEWLFVMAGKVRMTIVDGKGAASQFDCDLEDVAFTPQGFGHYVESIGNEPARLMLIHNHADFTTVNLSEWVAGGSIGVFASTLKMPARAFDDAPKKKVFMLTKEVKG